MSPSLLSVFPQDTQQFARVLGFTTRAQNSQERRLERERDMEALGKIHSHHFPLHLSLPSSPSFPKPLLPSPSFPRISISKTPLTVSFNRTHIPPKSLPSLPKPPQNLFPFLNPPNPSSPKTPQNPSPSQKPLSSLLKTISISIAAAALFLARFPAKPSFAAAPSVTVDSIPSDADSVSEAEKERTLERFLDSHPDDVEALKALMETKIKLRKLSQAIDAIDRLVVLQPAEKEWPLLRAHLHLYGGDVDTAKSAFEDIIAANPFRVEAYHGLAMAVVQSEPEDLEALVKRIEDVMEYCKKEKKKEDVRDFKLLVAQVRVIEGKYEEALKLYQELVKEEPRDFRPYICQGIIYTLIGKKDEAEKMFDKYRSLVPKGHPYAQYFDENVMATKVFSQMAEKEKAGSKR